MFGPLLPPPLLDCGAPESAGAPAGGCHKPARRSARPKLTPRAATRTPHPAATRASPVAMPAASAPRVAPPPPRVVLQRTGESHALKRDLDPVVVRLRHPAGRITDVLTVAHQGLVGSVGADRQAAMPDYRGRTGRGPAVADAAGPFSGAWSPHHSTTSGRSVSMSRGCSNPPMTAEKARLPLPPSGAEQSCRRGQGSLRAVRRARPSPSGNAHRAGFTPPFRPRP